VFTVAHHRLISERRRGACRPTAKPGADVIDDAGGDPDQENVDDLASQRVEKLCANLSEELRDVLLLRVLGDLSTHEVAKIVGKSVTAVKAFQSGALNSLGKGIEMEGVPL
jgi:DNA-directed RNA polymerase specialized sigma24 family protein